MNAHPSYANFDLQILRQGTGYVSRVMSSPKGEGSAHFDLPQMGLEAENMRLLGGKRGKVRTLDTHVGGRAKEIGEGLFRASFTGEVLERFNESRAWALAEKKRLRIRLRLDEASQQLPWEYLRVPGAGGRQLGLDRDTPLVRYIEMAEPPPRPRVEGALKILAVIASPSDRVELNVEDEWLNMQRALADLMQAGTVKVKRVQPPTFKALAQELERDDYHVFHFVGHGGWDEQTQEGVLVFAREDGREQLIGSDLLGPILGAKQTLQLAVLNACEGAVSKGKDIFAGSAQRLVGYGTPAVVAMQAEITDEAAIDFSAGFYSSLAAGRPVDAAVTDGRRLIFAEPNPFEWGTPVLYMRAGDGMLFDVAPSSARADADTIPIGPLPPPPGPQVALRAKKIASGMLSRPLGKVSGRPRAVDHEFRHVLARVLRLLAVGVVGASALFAAFIALVLALSPGPLTPETARGALLFEARLDQAGSDVDLVNLFIAPDPSAAEARFSDGSLELVVVKPQSEVAVRFVGDPPLDFYGEIVVSVRPGRDAGIVWDVRGGDQRGDSIILSTATGEILIRHDDYAAKTNTELTRRVGVAGLRNGRDVTLGVHAKGNELRVFADGKLLASATTPHEAKRSLSVIHLFGGSGGNASVTVKAFRVYAAK